MLSCYPSMDPWGPIYAWSRFAHSWVMIKDLVLGCHGRFSRKIAGCSDTGRHLGWFEGWNSGFLIQMLCHIFLLLSTQRQRSKPPSAMPTNTHIPCGNPPLLTFKNPALLD